MHKDGVAQCQACVLYQAVESKLMNRPVIEGAAWPTGLPSIPSIELLGPGSGGTEPGVASKRAMYLADLGKHRGQEL